MSKAEYAAKLRDPRWQKKRLKILERDKWKCVLCGRENEPLHVHHKKYSAGDPWDEPNKNLATLCETHHYAIHSDCAVVATRVRLTFENFHSLKAWSKTLTDYPDVVGMKFFIAEPDSDIARLFEADNG